MIRFQKHMLKSDDLIVKYPDHPGFEGAETDAGSGNRVQGSSEADLGDDISRNPHFLPKNSFIFQEHAFFVLTPPQLTRKSLELDVCGLI